VKESFDPSRSEWPTKLGLHFQRGRFAPTAAIRQTNVMEPRAHIEFVPSHLT
jgi:hypothetical protein